MSKGLLERAYDKLKGRKREVEDRLDEILGNGETKDDDSQHPQGKDVRTPPLRKDQE